MSDHFMISFEFDLQKLPPVKKCVVCRNIKGIPLDVFREDLLSSKLVLNPTSDIDELMDLYVSTLDDLLDKHSPSVTRTITVQPNAPWYNYDIQTAKVHRRRTERKWSKSGLEVDRQIYQQARTDLKKLIRNAKLTYCREMILSNSNNPKVLWNQLSKLLGKGDPKPLPTEESDEILSEKFNSYFITKIDNIRAVLRSLQSSTPKDITAHDHISGERLAQFEPVLESEVLTLLKKSKQTTCELDHIPTSLLMKVSDVLIPVITHIVNTSLQTGRVPKAFKEAVVKPLLKKQNLDVNTLSNYRPVSNLSFTSKILEKAVAKQLTQHLDTHGLSCKFQSAYKRSHSTKTALVRVVNDLRSVVDRGDLGMLVLLDLSAAFHTIDHEILK
ncbi:uncharacterized protein LOC124254759 [Haliotis rubra]|uniref:uncharacterized protein LOC124254759 n=1 Tax=Haliotis rubra TaxID=36100 RepID=UPI001EE4FEE7|nr:uncharacterized protein LOC124254759 [Haliotis rubra]